MRHFFINALDKVVGIIVILGAILVLVGTIGALVVPEGSLLTALGVLAGGSIYLILVGGTLYLGLGIYANTKATADALQNR